MTLAPDQARPRPDLTFLRHRRRPATSNPVIAEFIASHSPRPGAARPPAVAAPAAASRPVTRTAPAPRPAAAAPPSSRPAASTSLDLDAPAAGGAPTSLDLGGPPAVPTSGTTSLDLDAPAPAHAPSGGSTSLDLDAPPAPPTPAGSTSLDLDAPAPATGGGSTSLDLGGPPAAPAPPAPSSSTSLDLGGPPAAPTPPAPASSTSLDLGGPPAAPAPPAPASSTSLDLGGPPAAPAPPAPSSSTSLDLGPTPTASPAPAARATGSGTSLDLGGGGSPSAPARPTGPATPPSTSIWRPARTDNRIPTVLQPSAPEVVLDRRQSAIGTLTIDAVVGPGVGDLRLGAAYQLTSGLASTVQHSTGRRFGPAHERQRPIVLASRGPAEQLEIDLRQVRDLERVVVYAFSGNGAPLQWGGTLRITTFGGAKIEIPLDQPPSAVVTVVAAIYQVDGELVVRAERDLAGRTVKEACRAYGFDRISWLDDQTPVD
ncbi:hypothetical protein FDO65_16915 [Nakamurella flava]|uniref:Tellurium resistance protein n=1 Tax=Nakamurella flava TaxID=2576308 RepID=A0A4U6QCJ1_9ACTN|nr:hypothetical protein [Nakamurella flava]TKV57814.1 hypothetical protein FDO65_16915 [Nakamurella flava]